MAICFCTAAGVRALPASPSPTRASAYPAAPLHSITIAAATTTLGRKRIGGISIGSSARSQISRYVLPR
jgi:hypothetical protein